LEKGTDQKTGGHGRVKLRLPKSWERTQKCGSSATRVTVSLMKNEKGDPHKEAPMRAFCEEKKKKQGRPSGARRVGGNDCRKKKIRVIKELKR